MNRNTLILILLVIFLSFADKGEAETVYGMVKAVYDGDTVALVGRGTGRLKVRLYGIDAPETAKPEKPGQGYSSQARRVLMYKLLGKEVAAEIQDRDQYGRAVAVLRAGNRDINAEMVAEGHAWAYRRYLAGSYSSRYIALEEQARRQRRGLWRESNPQPPWEFRNSGKRRR